MPYLHWETDRGRTKLADVIKKASEIKNSMVEIVGKATANEQNRRSYRNTADNDVEASISMDHQEQTPTSPAKIPSQAERRKVLGQLLRLAAALAEAMDYNVDEKLIYRYLHEQPALHPRRTLDQSYYGALKSTKARDRDQVVYRATVPLSHTCLKEPDKNNACQQCNEEIRKVPRLIMVDQLWLWILDESMPPVMSLVTLPLRDCPRFVHDRSQLRRDGHHLLPEKMGQAQTRSGSGSQTHTSTPENRLRR
jgi:hypothetical protein